MLQKVKYYLTITLQNKDSLLVPFYTFHIELFDSNIAIYSCLLLFYCLLYCYIFLDRIFL